MMWNKWALGDSPPLFLFLKNVLTRCSDGSMIRISKQNTEKQIMKTKMSIQAKRELLDSFAGRFYSIEWVKSNGEVRSCTGKHMQHNMFAAGHASKAQANTVAHKPNLYTMVDVTNEKWVNVNLNNLKHVRCGSIDIEFED